MTTSIVQQYSDYQDSGVEWLGAVPAQWTKRRHKDVFELITDRCNDTLLDKVALEHIESETGRFIPLESDFEGGGVEFEVNDILFGKLRPYLAKAYLADFRGSAVGDIFVYRPRRHILPKFAHYLMLSHSYIEVINRSTAGAKMPRANSAHIAGLPVYAPPISEQEAIANYLSKKIAEIDQRIALLSGRAEKYLQLKQSLINESVLQGLNKTAPTKDSGVAWLGDIPAHWSLSAVTHVTTPVSIKNHPDEELLSVYRDYGVIIKSTRDDNHNKAGADLAGYKLVEPGYLVINKMKAWQGSLGISSHRGIVSPAYITCKTNSKLVERRYLHYLLRCRAYINEYNRLSYGIRVDQWDMRYHDFKYMPVLLPPLHEQQAIANYIDEKTAQIDQIVAIIYVTIEKHKELRKALINDVVTGKIKVT